MRFYLSCLLLGSLALTGVLGAGTSCNCGWVNKGRIVGGQEAPKNKYPMIAALIQPNGFHFCGGTILTPYHVITAAHCTFGQYASQINVKVGAHDKMNSGVVYRIEKIINHERYDHFKTVNDIAILVTATQMGFNEIIGPACLPDTRLSITGQIVKALGWGRTSSGGRDSQMLLEVDLNVVSFEECRRGWIGKSTQPQQATNMCTYTSRKDTCQGDSGGPLIWLDPSTGRYALVALVSYGIGCASPTPAVNTDVSAYLGWIESQIRSSKPGVAACKKIGRKF